MLMVEGSGEVQQLHAVSRNLQFRLICLGEFAIPFFHQLFLLIAFSERLAIANSPERLTGSPEQYSLEQEE